MESPSGSQYSEADLREAAVQLAADLRDEFHKIKRPSFAAQVNRIRDALTQSDAMRAAAIWEELVPIIPAAAPRRRMFGVDFLSGALARVLSEMTGSQVAAPDFDAPAPPSSVGTTVKRCILFLFGTGSLALGIVIIRMQPLAGTEEIARIACGLLFAIGGPVFLVRASRGDRKQVDEDFGKLLDGL